MTAPTDPKAFDELVRPHRSALAGHCYRMLGSLADADDAVQETLVRAWKGLDGFEERAALRTWLFRIATNVCIDAAARRKARPMPPADVAPLPPGARTDPGPFDEIHQLEPAPPELWREETPEAAITARESVRIAFLCALQRLPASQRAVLLLRDVLGWSADEVASLLETSVPAVNSALQRARATVGSRAAEPPPEDPSLGALLARYLGAWESGAPEQLVTLLREDVVVTMPPMPAWIFGRDATIDLRAWLATAVGEMRGVPTQACGAPAVAWYVRPAGHDRFVASGIHVLRFADGLVAEIHAFLGPQLFARFGLPDVLPDPG
jgi:RNA polymerase sigma-70 factor, ECF subfamily